MDLEDMPMMLSTVRKEPTIPMEEPMSGRRTIIGMVNSSETGSHGTQSQAIRFSMQ